MGVSFAPVIDFDARTVGGRFVLAGISLGALYCFLRLWPVYVVQYIFRDSPADLWEETWHIKFPDAGIAWRLTGVRGALWHTSVPVFIGIILIGAYSLAVSEGFIRNELGQLSQLVLECGLYFGLLPFVHLLIVERAMRLAIVSEKALAQAMTVAEAGAFWFVRGLEREEQAGWVGAYRDPSRRARLHEILGIDDRRAVGAIEDAFIGLHRAFRGLDSATTVGPLARTFKDLDPINGLSLVALNPEERAVLTQACWPVLRSQQPLKYRYTNKEMQERGKPYEQQFTYMHALYLAAELLQKADPSLSLYRAKKLCLQAYKTLYDASAFHLTTEDRLCWLGEEVPVPTIDSRYRKLMNLKKVPYWVTVHGLSHPDCTSRALLPMRWTQSLTKRRWSGRRTQETWRSEREGHVAPGRSEGGRFGIPQGMECLVEEGERRPAL